MHDSHLRRSLTVLGVAVLGALACDSPPPTVGSLEARPSRTELAYPGTAAVELTWGMEAPLGEVEGDLRVWVHLVDQRGGVARTFDHPFPGDWAPGGSASYGVELYQSALAPPLTEGVYGLSVGLYDAAGRRWLVSSGVEGAPEDPSAEVRVTGAPDDFPMFYFSPDWFAVEGGTDRQVLARRWLGERGALKVAGVRRPGKLSMMIGLPTDAAEVDELVLDDGVSELTVTATSSCGGDPVTVTGPGSHRIEIPIAAGADGVTPEECEISFEASFYLISLETLARRTLALETLSWSYADGPEA